MKVPIAINDLVHWEKKTKLLKLTTLFGYISQVSESVISRQGVQKFWLMIDKKSYKADILVYVDF